MKCSIRVHWDQFPTDQEAAAFQHYLGGFFTITIRDGAVDEDYTGIP